MDRIPEWIDNWLLRWEPARYFPKHEKSEPVPMGNGYQWQPSMWDCVNRAICVDGTVSDPVSGLTWENSPQVLHWLSEPKKGVMRLIVRRVKNAVRRIDQIR